MNVEKNVGAMSLFSYELMVALTLYAILLMQVNILQMPLCKKISFETTRMNLVLKTIFDQTWVLFSKSK